MELKSVVTAIHANRFTIAGSAKSLDTTTLLGCESRRCSSPSLECDKQPLQQSHLLMHLQPRVILIMNTLPARLFLPLRRVACGRAQRAVNSLIQYLFHDVAKTLRRPIVVARRAFRRGSLAASVRRQ